MENFWAVMLQPLILISGIGIMLMSTTARYGHLEHELHHMPEDGSCEKTFVTKLARRATLFRTALVALYTAVAILCIGSVGGAVLGHFFDWAPVMVMVLTCVAFVFVMVAALMLANESRFASDMFFVQLRQKFPDAKIDP